MVKAAKGAGVGGPSPLEEALAQRERLQPGQTIYTPAGHAVSRHSLAFYAADSEQAAEARADELADDVEGESA